MVKEVTSAHPEGRFRRFDTGRGLELGVACTGIAMIALAGAADTAWFDRHFLPSFFTPRHQQLAIDAILRLVVASLGLAILLFGRSAVRRYARTRQAREIIGTAIMSAGALFAAILTTELIMRTQTWHAAQFHNQQEPRRVYDPGLGWVFLPGHRGQDLVAGRRIDYVMDSHGYRIAAPSGKLDFRLPTIILSGESVMAGAGLPWQEATPGQVGAHFGDQIADIAVNGYSTDQSYMRLRNELPRFSCPVTVVTLFMTSFLERNLNDDRPHLDRDLRWHPARQGWRLAALAGLVVPYRSKRTIDAGVAMTSAVLRATVALARSRGAASLIVVPSFTPESTAERALRKRILDDAGLDYVLVPIDSHWRLTGDMHPDVHGARAIAAAISRRLEPYGLGSEVSPDKQGHNSCGSSMR